MKLNVCFAIIALREANENTASRENIGENSDGDRFAQGPAAGRVHKNLPEQFAGDNSSLEVGKENVAFV